RREKRFNQLSIEERTKIDEETLVNVDGFKRQSTTSKRSDSSGNEYISVKILEKNFIILDSFLSLANVFDNKYHILRITILVAAKGIHKLCVVNSNANLKKALQNLGSMPISKLLAVEVLWTPQVENDIMSEHEILEDYPILRPLA
ncbi:hypothetical protein MKX03_015661, partial [Papaver bracteatum]